MKLVKFEDGKYGIRRWWFFGWYFQDLLSPSLVWHCRSHHFRDCRGRLNDVEYVYNKLKRKRKGGNPPHKHKVLK